MFSVCLYDLCTLIDDSVCRAAPLCSLCSGTGRFFNFSPCYSGLN